MTVSQRPTRILILGGGFGGVTEEGDPPRRGRAGPGEPRELHGLPADAAGGDLGQHRHPRHDHADPPAVPEHEPLTRARWSRSISIIVVCRPQPASGAASVTSTTITSSSRSA